SRGTIVGPKAPFQRLAESTQSLIAGLMAECVVQTFEVIEIRDDHRELAAAANEVVHLDLERAAVQQAGQAIGHRLQLCALEGANGAGSRRRGEREGF